MLNILFVCTGNICRSPIAAQVLEARLSDISVNVTSAGTRTREGTPMTPQALALAVANGGSAERAASHGARLLTEPRLGAADLVVAMSREHRREVVEILPAFTRKAFTLRELSRLSADVPDSAMETATAESDADPRAVLRSNLAVVASRRGAVPPPLVAEDDDVIDPFGRADDVYRTSLEQILGAMPAVERLIRLSSA